MFGFPSPHFFLSSLNFYCTKGIALFRLPLYYSLDICFLKNNFVSPAHWKAPRNQANHILHFLCRPLMCLAKWRRSQTYPCCFSPATIFHSRPWYTALPFYPGHTLISCFTAWRQLPAPTLPIFALSPLSSKLLASPCSFLCPAVTRPPSAFLLLLLCPLKPSQALLVAQICDFTMLEPFPTECWVSQLKWIPWNHIQVL